jgi:hypothetical protein
MYCRTLASRPSVPVYAKGHYSYAPGANSMFRKWGRSLGFPHFCIPTSASPYGASS